MVDIENLYLPTILYDPVTHTVFAAPCPPESFERFAQRSADHPWAFQ